MTCNHQQMHALNLNALIHQVSVHHAALMRCQQFSGRLRVAGDNLELSVGEDDTVLLALKMNLKDPFILDRLSGAISTMQSIMPAYVAHETTGGAA